MMALHSLRVIQQGKLADFSEGGREGYGGACFAPGSGSFVDANRDLRIGACTDERYSFGVALPSRTRKIKAEVEIVVATNGEYLLTIEYIITNSKNSDF
ncbi:MAG: hypothetical protein WA885_19265 [Phormidesmis sp.]